MEKEDPFEEPLKLTTRWREITKPEMEITAIPRDKGNDIIPPRTLKAEEKNRSRDMAKKKQTSVAKTGRDIN